MTAEWSCEFFLYSTGLICKKRRKSIQIYIESYIDLENGNLVIHGHDLMRRSKRFLQTDYEYW